MKRLAVLLCLCAGPAAAQSLDMPGNAVLVVESSADPERLRLATGPAAGSGPRVKLIDGRIGKQVWRIGAAGLTTGQIAARLTRELQEKGFETLFDCAASACGGFDFRFGIDVTPPPEMFVDLGDFRYISARRPVDGGDEYVTILISRSSRAGFVELRFAGPSGSALPAMSEAAGPSIGAEAAPAVSGTLAERLDAAGHAALIGVDFPSGSSELATPTPPVLAELAEYLSQHPGRRIALVGHTDATGSIDGNIALSRRRAAAVLERLVTEWAVPRPQVEAAGMGYLAPVASNLDPQGREANRRVEAILLSDR